MVSIISQDIPPASPNFNRRNNLGFAQNCTGCSNKVVDLKQLHLVAGLGCSQPLCWMRRPTSDWWTPWQGRGPCQSCQTSGEAGWPQQFPGLFYRGRILEQQNNLYLVYLATNKLKIKNFNVKFSPPTKYALTICTTDNLSRIIKPYQVIWILDSNKVISYFRAVENMKVQF